MGVGDLSHSITSCAVTAGPIPKPPGMWGRSFMLVVPMKPGASLDDFGAAG
jgi:hypothetical protein